MGFAEANSVYVCSKRTSYLRLRSHHSGFREFSLRVSRFQREVSDENADSDVSVERFLRMMKRFRYQVSAAPISFGLSPMNSPENIRLLEIDRQTIVRAWPSLGDSASLLAEGIRHLFEEDCAPYLECATCPVCNIGPAEAMVLWPTDLLSAARKTIDEVLGHEALLLLSPAELKRGKTYERLLLAGPFSWFDRHSSHVLSAPRAHELVSLSYEWLPDDWRLKSVFADSEVGPADGGPKYQEMRCGTHGQEAAVTLEDQEVLPSIPKLDELPIHAPSGERLALDHEPVPTQGFLLEPASLLVVENDDNSKMLIIDFSIEKRVDQVPLSDIEPGMFLLHRSSGGGDFIVEVADRLLGRDCKYLRGRQRLWKERLRMQVRDFGYEGTAERLLALGSRIASYQNVRNWVSPRNIRTHRYEDFNAIMSLVGLSDESLRLWREMTRIKGAHLKAGARVRKMLLQQVLESDQSELQRLGCMDYHLGVADGGALTAQRVLERVQTPDYPPEALPLLLDI